MLSFAQRACVCVYVRERERETGSHHSPAEIVLITDCLQTHTSFINLCLSSDCSPLGVELMVKLRTLLTVFTLNLKGLYIYKT